MSGQGEGKSLAIVGFSPTFAPVPFDDDGWDCWGLNEGYLARPGYDDLSRWDAWFNIHTNEVIQFTSPMFLSWVRTMRCPVYSIEPLDCPDWRMYPLDDVLKEFPDYFTSSVPYPMDLGFLMGYKEICLYGVNQGVEEQPAQRACIEYHAGLIEGRGVPVTADRASRLLQHARRYGYESRLYHFPEHLERPEAGYREGRVTR